MQKSRVNQYVQPGALRAFQVMDAERHQDGNASWHFSANRAWPNSFPAVIKEIYDGHKGPGDPHLTLEQVDQHWVTPTANSDNKFVLPDWPAHGPPQVPMLSGNLCAMAAAVRSILCVKLVQVLLAEYDSPDDTWEVSGMDGVFLHLSAHLPLLLLPPPPSSPACRLCCSLLS